MRRGLALHALFLACGVGLWLNAQPPGRHPREPAEAVAFADQMQALLAMLDEQERQVVGLKLQDLTNEQIAERLNLAERTIRRTMKRVEEKLRESVGEG